MEKLQILLGELQPSSVTEEISLKEPPLSELFTRDDVSVFPSRGEMRKMVQGGGVSLNKERLETFDRLITADDLIDGKYLLVQRGKKNYFLITVK